MWLIIKLEYNGRNVLTIHNRIKNLSIYAEGFCFFEVREDDKWRHFIHHYTKQDLWFLWLLYWKIKYGSFKSLLCSWFVILHLIWNRVYITIINTLIISLKLIYCNKMYFHLFSCNRVPT